MTKKNYLILDNEFIEYCKLNNIDDIDKLAKEVFNKGFTILKYGDSPPIVDSKTKTKGKKNKQLPIPQVSPPPTIKSNDIYLE